MNHSFKELSYQIWDLTISNLKQRYRKTFAGFLWVVLNPLIMFGVQSLVFKKFLNVNVPNFFLFLASGLLPWIFLTQTLTMTTTIYTNSSLMLKSFRINPLVLVISQCLDNLINFLFAFVLILLPIWATSEGANFMGILTLPLNLLVLIMGTISLAVFLSTLNVFFRDTAFILSFAIGIVYFMTPIFYPRSYVPEHLQWLINLNVFYYFIEPFRESFFNFEAKRYTISVVKGLLMSSSVTALTIYYWRKKKNEFYYYL